MHSSYNRWGNDLIDHSLGAKYKKRLGNESYRTTADQYPVGYEGGGLRSDYLSMYESFVAYESIDQAAANFNAESNLYRQNIDNPADPSLFTSSIYIHYDTSKVVVNGKETIHIDTINYPVINSKTEFVPVHQKYSFNFDLDWAYDFGPIVGYPRDLFLSLYFALNGVSTSFRPIALNSNDKDMLLWGTYLRCEPAIALSKKFYVLGLAGFEQWTSQKTYVNTFESVSRTAFKHIPIDYRDYALGVGFDWDMLARVGLHGRFKLMKHDDIQLPDNNYQTPVISTEIKMWF
jgi:hypothetical protein